ncbi:hypothetical protein BDW69DRAFT_131371 [Aspergillus filifer]
MSSLPELYHQALSHNDGPGYERKDVKNSEEIRSLMQSSSDSSPPSPPKVESPEPDEKPHIALQVLIAQRDTDTRHTLEHDIWALGHEVSAFDNWTECVEWYIENLNADDGRQKVDVVFLGADLVQGHFGKATLGIRGAEQAFEFQRGEKHQVNIILVSRGGTHDTPLALKKIGLDGWILRPIHQGRLNAMLRSLHDSQLRTGISMGPGSDGLTGLGGWF